MNTYEKIIDSLSDCVEACESCATLCLEEDNVKKMTGCIKLDLDCAEICALAVKLLSRDSQYAKSIISLCADACAQCAEEGEKHDHQHCKECAEACRNCEEICKTHLDTLRQAAVNS